MGKRYFVELSRKDIGLVSYFPGVETKDDPDADWIDEVLVPALQPIATRTAAKIREMPISFWICVRGTARHKAEVFLFMTPAYPGALIDSTVHRTLQPIKGGNVHAAREPIPKEAVPCLQIFRGRLIRFYSYLGHHDGCKWFYIPTIRYQNESVRLTPLPIPESKELIAVDVPIEEMNGPMVEARILSISDGESCRKFQKALVLLAQQVNK